ncbi:hypothetical protein GYB59_06290 [bacterium]|nr:hypothetical protein [bacterium]
MTNAFDCPPDVTEEELERVQRSEQRTREQLNVYRIPLWRLAQTAVSGRAIPFDELHQQDQEALTELLRHHGLKQTVLAIRERLDAREKDDLPPNDTRG